MTLSPKQSSRSCLIVGGGLSGLVAARVLSESGWHITLIDKSRGLGGRMATRRWENAVFDHGAQFFTTRDPEFVAQTREWETNGHASTWFATGTNGDRHARYRALPGMSTLPRLLLPQGANLHLQQTAQLVEWRDGQWHATTAESERFHADVLILTPPAPQTLKLLQPVAANLPTEALDLLHSVEFSPCFSLLVALKEGAQTELPDPGYLRVTADDNDRHGSPIQTISDNHRKGISPRPGAITIHTTGAFSQDHFDVPEAQLTPYILTSAEPYIGRDIEHTQLHRWRYSQPLGKLDNNFVFAQSPGPLLVTGDAYAGSRIEGAFLSGLRGARHLLGAS